MDTGVINAVDDTITAVVNSGISQPINIWNQNASNFQLGDEVWNADAAVFAGSATYDWTLIDTSGSMTNSSNTLDLVAGADIGTVPFGRVASIGLESTSASLDEAQVENQWYGMEFQGKRDANQDIDFVVTDVLAGGSDSYSWSITANPWQTGYLLFQALDKNLTCAVIGFDAAAEEFWLDNISMKKQSRGLGPGNWDAVDNNIVVVDGDGLRCIHVDNTVGMTLLLDSTSDLSSDLIVGREYEISFMGKVTNGTVNVYAFNGGSTAITTISSTSLERGRGTFVYEASQYLFVDVPSGGSTWVNDFKLRLL